MPSYPCPRGESLPSQRDGHGLGSRPGQPGRRATTLGPPARRPIHAALRSLPRREAAINAPSPAAWAYTESFRAEDEALERARARARELGCGAIGSSAGALLGVLAASAQARAVVEIGTGAGVSGTYLLRGMPADGLLTTIDAEVEHQRAAREAYAEAGVRAGRVRVIAGRALDVLPRLTDAAYDLVFVDAEPQLAADYCEQGLRLLRPGGVLVVNEALARGAVADPARRDPVTTGVREAGRMLRDDVRLQVALLPIGTGLLVAAREGRATGPTGGDHAQGARGVAR